MKEQNVIKTSIQCKPFLKWAGGKGQLLDTIISYLPNDMSAVKTYVEPFVGSGAVMFYVISNYQNITQIIINDLNTELINLYSVIKDDVESLIANLKELDKEYKSFSTVEECSIYYYRIREEFNNRCCKSDDRNIRLAALFVFLNRTCFNGLYRVNGKNLFNVPFGKYQNPKICDEDNLRAVNKVLQRVTILNCDFADTIQYADIDTLFYLDPPYKPISATSSFNTYSTVLFDDEQQIRLKSFCDTLHLHNAKFILSNSDPKGVDENNTFFDDLYHNYNIYRVEAKRNINSKGDKRGKINELLITNF